MKAFKRKDLFYICSIALLMIGSLVYHVQAFVVEKPVPAAGKCCTAAQKSLPSWGFPGIIAQVSL